MIYLLKSFVILSGFLLFFSINPIFSILSLISIFIFTGSLFIYFDLSFLGLAYFIVYVGAISILFIFAIMMLETDQFINPLLKEKLGLKKEIPLIFGLIFLSLFSYYQFIFNPPLYIFDFINGINNNSNLYITNDYLWESNLFSLTQLQLIGYNLYTYYSLWLILISFILLLAMIGPIILCLGH